MKKLKISITGCLGRMGTQLIKTAKKNKHLQIESVTERKTAKKKKMNAIIQAQRCIFFPNHKGYKLIIRKTAAKTRPKFRSVPALIL